MLKLGEGQEMSTTISEEGLRTFRFTIELSYVHVGVGFNGMQAALDTVECPSALDSFPMLTLTSFAECFASMWLLLQLDNEGTTFRMVFTDCSRALACMLRLGTDKGLEMDDTIFGDDLLGLSPMAKGSWTSLRRLFVSLNGTEGWSRKGELRLVAERVV